MKTPLPQQAKGRDYLLKRGSGQLFMEMRTGKTFTSVLSLAEWKPSSVLIICPTTVMAVWASEFVEYGIPESQVVEVTGPKKKRQKLLDGDQAITIVNFEMIKPYKMKFHKYKAIILDESYRIANPNSGITTYLLREDKPDYQHRVVLSGNPAPESKLNLVTQFLWSDGHFMGHKSYSDYYLAYWAYNSSTRKHVCQPGHLEEIDKYVAQNSYCVTQKELGIGGPRVHKYIYVDAPAAINREALNLSDEDYKYRNKDGELKKISPLTRGLFLQMVSSGLQYGEDSGVANDFKREFIIGYIKENLDDAPILILSAYIGDITRLCGMLNASGYNSEYIHGDVEISERKNIIKRFGKETQIIVAQTKTVKMGLDFSVADTIMYSSNTFSCDDRSQADERTTNVMKKRPTEIIDVCTRIRYLEGPASFDKFVAKTVRDKKEVSAEVLRKRFGF